MNKEQTFKLIEGRLETITQMSIECFELIYNAGMIDGANDALEYAAKLAEPNEKLCEEIRRLKK